MLSNIKILSLDLFVVSGVAIMNPCTSMIISSSVSEKICCMVSIAFCKSLMETPTAPMYNVSFVPIANNAVCMFATRGDFFIV